MAEKLSTQKKVFVGLIESVLVKHMSVGEAHPVAKGIYAAIRHEIARRIVLEPIEVIERKPRMETICETLRQAYAERDPERARELISTAYNYAQRMNERLQYYYKRETAKKSEEGAPE